MLFCMAFGAVRQADATHYRAGDLTFVITGNLQITATLTTYTKISGQSLFADRDVVTISWGDGTSDSVGRVNGPMDPMTGYAHYGVLVAADIKQNIYIGTHTYSGVPPAPNNFFIVSFLDDNRMAGINNISDGNSVDVPFYVEDTIYFWDLNSVGLSSSPILLHMPIDYADVNDTFYHNPLAITQTLGDSLAFALKVPLDAPGSNVPLYQYPDQYCNALGGNPMGGEATESIDETLPGQYTWAVPCVTGFFNIAILVHSYRDGLDMGSMERDMQIIVLQDSDVPPHMANLPDTCIRAGDTLIQHITATHPKMTFAGNDTIVLTISAAGGPFLSYLVGNDTALWDSVPGNPATGTFTWNTDCDAIAEQPYEVLFDASDNYVYAATPAPLVDLVPWLITVIPPPVTGLTATAKNSGVTLTWDSLYKCSSNPNFHGFSIWRRIGCDPFVPGYCETGLAGTGYEKISTNNVLGYSYTDNTAILGQSYSYRVLAEFYTLPPSGVYDLRRDIQESVPSNEVCIFIPISLPVITNVSVNTTDPVNGSIFVRWTKPLAGGTNLDTTENPPPYRFDVYRQQGYGLNNNAVLVHSSATASSYSAIYDTTFTDTLIDTKDNAWTYRVLFYYSNSDTLGGTQPASSVFLHLTPSNKALTLTWQDQVPWLNDSFAIFMLNKTTSLYDSIGVAYTASFTDSGLINDTNYCFYVKSYGHYTVSTLPTPLINLSQRDCDAPNDTAPPCAPTLNVYNDCSQFNGQPWTASTFTNYLSWTIPNDTCSFNVVGYYIYYGSDTSTGLTLLDSVSSKFDTTYSHTMKDNLAGCYAVTAIDAAGTQSHFSNIFCVDNCPYYVLPNAFTPNGDGHNDLFTPFPGYRFVTKIDMKIYNRWGEQVFETSDPAINWDGKDQRTGKDVSEGVYIYAGYYYEQRLGGLVRKPLSGEKKGGGFIELIRGNKME